MSAIELLNFFLDEASTADLTADFPPLLTVLGMSSLESEKSELEESVAEALSFEEEEESAELDALENESGAEAENIVAAAASALT